MVLDDVVVEGISGIVRYRIIKCFPELPFDDCDYPAWLVGGASVIGTMGCQAMK